MTAEKTQREVYGLRENITSKEVSTRKPPTLESRIQMTVSAVGLLSSQTSSSGAQNKHIWGWAGGSPDSRERQLPFVPKFYDSFLFSQYLFIYLYIYF